jgi:hypothetical protein
MSEKIISIINFKNTKCYICSHNCPRQKLLTDNCEQENRIKALLDSVINKKESVEKIQEEFEKMEDIFQKGKDEIERYLKKLRKENKIHELDRMTEYLEQKVRFIKENYNGPTQLILIDTDSDEYKNKKLLIAADCAAFTEDATNTDFGEDTAVILFCPHKKNAQSLYIEKMANIFSKNDIKSLQVIQTENECCQTMSELVKMALLMAERILPKENLTFRTN